MTDPADDLVDADRRAFRAMIYWIIGAALYGFAATSALALALNMGWIARAWIAAHPALVVCGIIVAPTLPALAIVLAYDHRIRAAAIPVRGRLVDVRERRSHLAVKLFLFVVPVEAAIAIGMDIDKGGRFLASRDAWYPINLALFAIFAMYVLLKQPDTDDEWSRDLRARAARTRFVAAVVGLAGVYGLLLADAAWARLAAPGALAAAVELALLHFLIADWRAGKEV